MGTKKLIETINSPDDLKKVSLQELPQVADEIRDIIIHTVAQTGGHLGASLGAVEIALGIHYVFNTPQDVVIWDVGHQAYAHKILTGRRDVFSTLRTQDGISGFPNRNESKYDAFTTGHGSTSLSYGLGVACSNALDKNNQKVVVVIGDGSLSGGMALEALNHAGHVKKNLIIILNDNEQSISPSVGGYRKYLTRIITNPVYNKVHKDLELFVKNIPMLGTRLVGAAKKVEGGLKNLIVPGVVFEELGVRYFGPIDGHDISMFIHTLKNIKDLEGPIVIHTLTKKGKGYKKAEQLPEKYHGVTPFDIETGLEDKKDTLSTSSYTEVFGQALVTLAKQNEKITAITAAMPKGTGLHIFEKEYPFRFFNVGMAEEHAVGFAAGLAHAGKIPVIAIYSTFLQRAYDQIIHDVCLQNLHVIFALDRGGLVGNDGPTHHGVFDFAYLRHIPNLVMMTPKDGRELVQMLSFAVQYKGPIALRYPRAVAIDIKSNEICPMCQSEVQNENEITLGKWEVLQQGEKIVLLACGSMVQNAFGACGLLARENKYPLLVNACWVKPLDFDMLDMIMQNGKYKYIITLEEGTQHGGVGSAIVEYCTQKYPSSQMQYKIVGLPDHFIEHANRNVLLEKYKLDVLSIVSLVQSYIKRETKKPLIKRLKDSL